MQSVQRVQGAAQARLIPDSQQQACGARTPCLDPGIPDVLGRALIEMTPDRNAVEGGFAEAQTVELFWLVQLEALRMRRTPTARLTPVATLAAAAGHRFS